MKKILLGIAILLVTGCTKPSAPVCTVAKSITDGLSAEIAVQLDCKGLDAIQATLTKQLVDLKVCEAGATSLIGDILCPRVVDALMDGALKTIPSEWQCSGGALKDGAKAKLMEICKAKI